MVGRRRANCRPHLESLEARWQPATIVPDLVSHWNFDEGPDWHDAAWGSVASATVAREAVAGNNAALTNSTGAAFVAGQQFTAVELDGTNDYLNTTSNIGGTLGGTASLAFWIRTTQTGGTSPANSPGLAGSQSAAGSGVQWGWLDNAGRIALSVNGVLVANSSRPINDDRWHFVVLTRDAASGRCQVFVDGNLSNSGVGPTGNIAGVIRRLGSLEIAGSAPRYLRGRLDQLSLFKTVLTNSRAADLQRNYGPKAWPVEAVAISGQTTTLPSVLFSAWDPDADGSRVVRFKPAGHGTVTNLGNGCFTYRSSAGYLGDDRFEVVIEDGRGGFATSVVNLTVTPAPSGSAANFTTKFTNFQALQAGGSEISLSSWRVPRAIDWNRDGRNDLLIGGGAGVWLYLNNGSAQAPSFAAGVKVQAAGVDISTGGTAVPIALADLTGDGASDLLVVESGSLKVRLYRNTAAASQTPNLAAFTYLKTSTNADVVLPDARFDAGDWDGDGRIDLVVGMFGGDAKVFLNTGSATSPVLSTTGTVIYNEAYNFYPRLTDFSLNGTPDLLRGINWGDIRFWLDPSQHNGQLSQSPTGLLTVTDASGAAPDLHALVDGGIIDLADFNGDGALDLLIGGHVNNRVYIAYGQAKDVTEYLADIETIYDAHPNDLGAALDANGKALLAQVNDAKRGIINLMRSAGPAARQQIYDAYAAHLSQYPFLQLSEPIDTAQYHLVPSMLAQDWLILHALLPDTPSHRAAVADQIGLPEDSGQRALYLEHGLILGDNLESSPGQLASLQLFMQSHPRASFPDLLLQVERFFGDSEAGVFETFTATKNVFGVDTGYAANEWAADLDAAIRAADPQANNDGDLFTFVVGHEATHSLDAYLNSRPNQDLRRRWGQMLVLAGGPDIVAQNNATANNGWIDWPATKSHFLSQGYWNGNEANWQSAWNTYWTSGPGAGIRDNNFMRGQINWFFENPQESLATQGNQHWADSQGRLFGAIDRFRRGFTPNLTEAVTFLEFLSAGLNRVPMFDIDANSAAARADWHITSADLLRNDSGYITQLVLSDGRAFQFVVDSNGVYTGVSDLVTTNRAPLLNTTLSPSLASVREDAVAPASTLVSSLLAGAVSDPDAGALRGIAVTSASPANGAWQYSTNGGTTWLAMGSVSDSAARLLPAWARLRFIPKADFHGTVKLYYRAWDQTQGSPGGSFDLAGNTGGTKAFSVAKENAALIVTPVNDPPQLTLGGALGYVHDGAAITLAAGAVVSDIDSANFHQGRLRVWITDGASNSNRLSIGSGFTVDGSNNVLLGGTVIGKRASSGFGTKELIVTFNLNATKATVQQLVRAITFKTVGGAPGQRKVVFTVSDGDGGLSAEVAKLVNVS